MIVVVMACDSVGYLIDLNNILFEIDMDFLVVLLEKGTSLNDGRFGQFD